MSCAGGGAAEGLDYAGALAQQAFATIAAAAEDVAGVFQKDAPELGAVLLVWSLHEAERFCTLIKRNALSPFAAPAGEQSSLSPLNFRPKSQCNLQRQEQCFWSHSCIHCHVAGVTEALRYC